MMIAQEKNAQIEYITEQKLLIQTWNGFVTSDIFRKMIDRTVAFSRESAVETIISDTSLMSIVKKEDTEYAASVMPALIANGLKKMAFVLPENVFTQMSVKNFETRTKDKVEDEMVQQFGSLQTARDWATGS
jgi:hypothetical protein